MSAELRSIEITNAYRDRLLAIRTAAARVTASGFARLDLADLDGSYAVWRESATAMLGAAKHLGAALSQRYLAAFVASETRQRATHVPPIDTEAYATSDRSGRPLAVALTPPLFTVKMRLAQGADHQAAIAAGAARMVRTVAGEAMAAPRLALSDLIQADDRTTGWQRVVGGGACGACLAAATGASRADDDVPEAHDSCQCVAEPVVRDTTERFVRPTGEEVFLAKTPEEQAQLFHGRGGDEKARLLRDGDVPFAALIASSPLATQPDAITEAPLSDLQAHVA